MSTLTADDIRRREESKEAVNETPNQGAEQQGYQLINEGVDDESFGVDAFGRVLIDDVPVTSGDDLWDPETGELTSPAQLQAELGEEPQWEEKPELGPAHAEPCPSCSHVTDLRDKTKANILGAQACGRCPMP